MKRKKEKEQNKTKEIDQATNTMNSAFYFNILIQHPHIKHIILHPPLSQSYSNRSLSLSLKKKERQTRFETWRRK